MKKLVVVVTIVALLLPLTACGNAISKSKAYALYEDAVEKLFSSEGLILEQIIESTDTIRGGDYGDGRKSVGRTQEYRFEWSNDQNQPKKILLKSIISDGDTFTYSDYFDNEIWISIENGFRTDHYYTLGTLRDEIDPLKPITFSKDSVRSVKTERVADGNHLTFKIGNGSSITWGEGQWDKNDIHDHDMDFEFNGIVEALIDTDGNFVTLNYELTTSSNTRDGDFIVAEFKSSTNIISNGAMNIVFPDDMAFLQDPSGSETNYWDTFYTSGTFNERSSLYYSPFPLPEREEATELKKGLVYGLSAFGAAKIRTTLYSTILSINTCLMNYSPQFWEDFDAGKWNILSYDSDQEVVTIDSMVSDLQGIKDCVNDQAFKQDLEAAQKLLMYSSNNKTYDGLLFAHHILSDLTYWGIMYDLEMLDLSVWEALVNIYEQEVFYGITSTWGHDYPEHVNERINSIDQGAIENAGVSGLKALVDLRDEEVSEMISGMDPDDLKLMKETLDGMNRMLGKLVYEGGKLADYYDRLLGDIGTCLSLTSNTALTEDLLFIQHKLSEYYEIPNRNTSNPEADQIYCLRFSKRTVNELSKVVFANDRPDEFNDYYYGMTRMLEGKKAIRQ